MRRVKVDNGETLSPRRLNRALLARQHLLEPSDKPLGEVIEDIGGLQTQYAPSGYLSLFSRIARFERAALTHAMEAREVVHGTLMRVTIHSVTARDYWPIVAGIRSSRQQWLTRITAGQRGAADLEKSALVLRDLFADGPLRARDLSRRVSELGYPRQVVGWASLWVDIVRIPPSGTWERRANDLYELAERWLPPDSVPGGLPDELAGVELLLRRYLGAFGPARLADFANWAGVPSTLATRAAAGLALRNFRDEQGGRLIDLPDAPLPAENTPAPVRFLPVWDPTLLVHCRRTQVLPEKFRPLLFNTRTPHSFNSFLVDGQVAGTWRYHSGGVLTDAFTELPITVQREVEAEAARLAQFHAQ